MQARHRPSKVAVAHSEVLVAVFVRICRYDIVAVKLQCPSLYFHKDNIIHDHSYLLSTYWCWFICETPSVLAHSVMLYYILQTLLLPN